MDLRQTTREKRPAERLTKAYLTVKDATGSTLTSGAGSADAIGAQAQADASDKALALNTYGMFLRDYDPSTGALVETSRGKNEVTVVIPKTGNDFPLLLEAFANGTKVSAEIEEFRNNPSDGQTEAFMTTKMENCYITRIEDDEDNVTYGNKVIQITFTGPKIEVEGNVSSRSGVAKFFNTAD